MSYQQQWAGAGGYHQPYPESDGSPTLAVLAGILGLGVAGMLGYATIDLLSDVSEAPELPGGWIGMFILNFSVVALALLGAILVFVRVLAGAFLLLAAGALAVLAIVVDGAIAELLALAMVGASPEITATSEYGAYWEAMFEFGNEQAVLFALTLFAGGILVLISALPPSLKYLRGRNAGYPQQGW